jgi:signal peptidase II
VTLRPGLAAALAVFAADQASKLAALALLPPESFAALVGSRSGGLGLTLVFNPGVVFGMIDPAEWHRRAATIILGIAIACMVLVRLLRSRHAALNLARGVVIGGVLGNVADRARVGAVVDWLVLHDGARVILVFNLADVAIIGGALALIGGALALSLRRWSAA